MATNNDYGNTYRSGQAVSSLLQCHFFINFFCLFKCSVVSFGAPAQNEYRLVVEGLVPISLQTSMVNLEQ